MSAPTIIITPQNSLTGLQSCWNRLLSACPHDTIFLTWEWHSAWWRLSGHGELHVLTVEVDGEVIGIAPLYNSGYDPEYAHLSVGLLLKAFCIRDAIAEGRRGFDFLQGDEPYKYDLGATDVPILRMRVEFGASVREAESLANG